MSENLSFGEAVKKVEEARRELEAMIVLRASKTIGAGLANLKVCRAELALKTAESRLKEVELRKGK